MQIYELGESILDKRYDGKSFIGCTINNMPFTPNKNWEAPRYNPFMLEELVAVHLTNQEVIDGELKPQSYVPMIIKSGWPEKSKEWFYPRETVHFTLNGFVDDHSGGQIQEQGYSWKDKKFAYILPLADIINQVISLFTHDTIVLGKIKLPSSTQIINNQTPQKINETIRNMGYKVFNIEGVKELDAAYIEGTKININHPINFSKILDKYKIDGAYTAPSINNILLLDDYLTMVFSVASHDNSLWEKPEIVIEEFKKRINYFKERHEYGKELIAPLIRLERGVQVYVDFLQDLKLWDVKRNKIIEESRNVDADKYMAASERIRLNDKLVREKLLWKNNQEYFSK